MKRDLWYHLNIKRATRLVLLLLGMSLTMVNCAKRSSPTGGAKDSLAPVFVKAIPPNFTTNFDTDEIRIYFDEFIKLKDYQKQFIASPPLANTQVSPQGSASKYITIALQDTLEPNTTYVFNFGLSITDNNEGNPFPSFKYVMSTGDYIDSLSVKGTIMDAIASKPDEYVTVMLYEADTTFTDSTVFKERPRYVTNTLDSLPTFNLDYLREGTYALVALKDEATNFTFQANKDKIGFLDQFITVPTDSSYTLKLFKEDAAYKSSRPQHASEGKIAFGITGNMDSVAIQMISNLDEELTSLITKKEPDTLYYWYKPTVKVDSLLFTASASGYLDTLTARIRTPKRDSLKIAARDGRNIIFDKPFTISSNVPLDSVDPSFIQVRKDSIDLVATTTLSEKGMLAEIKFDQAEDALYNINILPGAFIDFFGQTNDTLNIKARSKERSDFGDIEITLLNATTFPYIVELLDSEDNLLDTRYTTEETIFTFPLLKASKYKIRLIEDANGNRVFDTGNYLKKRQPERVINYPGTIEVRPSWFAKETFELKPKVPATPAPPEKVTDTIPE